MFALLSNNLYTALVACVMDTIIIIVMFYFACLCCCASLCVQQSECMCKIYLPPYCDLNNAGKYCPSDFRPFVFVCQCHNHCIEIGILH